MHCLNVKKTFEPGLVQVLALVAVCVSILRMVVITALDDLSWIHKVRESFYGQVEAGVVLQLLIVGIEIVRCRLLSRFHDAHKFTPVVILAWTIAFLMMVVAVPFRQMIFANENTLWKFIDALISGFCIFLISIFTSHCLMHIYNPREREISH